MHFFSQKTCLLFLILPSFLYATPDMTDKIRDIRDFDKINKEKAAEKSSDANNTDQSNISNKPNSSKTLGSSDNANTKNKTKTDIKTLKSIPQNVAGDNVNTNNDPSIPRPADEIVSPNSKSHPANKEPNSATSDTITVSPQDTAKNSAPDLSDYDVKLNISQTNAVKISNVDLFNVVSDPDEGDIFTIHSVSNLRPKNSGCVTIIDGEIIYIAAKGFLGDAVFDYTVEDGEGLISDTEQVTVKVQKEN